MVPELRVRVTRYPHACPVLTSQLISASKYSDEIALSFGKAGSVAAIVAASVMLAIRRARIVRGSSARAAAAIIPSTPPRVLLSPRADDADCFMCAV